jgi:hypothetical protein
VVTAERLPLDNLGRLLPKLSLLYRLRVRKLDKRRRKRNPKARYLITPEYVVPACRQRVGAQLLRLGFMLFLRGTLAQRLSTFLLEACLDFPASALGLLLYRQQLLSLQRLLVLG